MEQVGRLEVAREAATKRLRFAHVDDALVGVAEQVNARGIRDVLGLRERGSHASILRFARPRKWPFCCGCSACSALDEPGLLLEIAQAVPREVDDVRCDR